VTSPEGRALFVYRENMPALKLVLITTLVVIAVTANQLVLKQVRQDALRKAAEQQEQSIKMLHELVRAKGDGLRVAGGALWAGRYRISGNNEIPDTLFHINGSRSTIFLGNTRVATTVLLPSGERAIGTTLSGPPYEALFRKGIPYRGETTILGVRYFAAYDPVKDAGGRVIGALFVGSRKKEYLASYEAMSGKIHLINAGSGVLLALFCWLLLWERKNSQKAIEKHLSYLQVLADTIPIPVFTKDRDGRYTGGNRAFQRFVGRSREELIGLTAEDLWDGELAGLCQRKDRELLETSGTQVYEAQIRACDGSLHDVICNKATFWNESGGAGGIVGVFLDITERKSAEEKVKGSYQRMADILEFLPDGVMVVDHQKRVMAWNRAMEEMTGIGKEILGQNDISERLYGEQRHVLVDLLDEEDAEIRRHYRNSGREGETIFADVAIGSRGRQDRIFRAAAAPLFNRDGSIAGAIQTMRDETEHRKAAEQQHWLEVQLHHSRMMESLLVQLGHDLKTPLTPLFALLPLLERALADERQQRMLEVCRQSAAQIQLLADKALELVRLSSQENRPVLLPVTLHNVAEEAISRIEPMLARRRISSVNEIDPTLAVPGAADQLAVLFENLLENAARYGADDGKVTMRAARRGGWVEVSVADDGVGLDPEHTSLIFCEFFKADRARHDLNTQGLGLAICQRIVTNHGGSIRADSRGRGLGTTIYFTLPGAGADAGEADLDHGKGTKR
jgi:PAS domain S-box-containing protein